MYLVGSLVQVHSHIGEYWLLVRTLITLLNQTMVLHMLERYYASLDAQKRLSLNARIGHNIAY